tara:strand:+ start:197 stop:568 length:372 start_codon:yes stop_codon:yes gene_type:complete
MRQSPFGGPASDALTDFVNKERCFIYETLELPKQYLEMFQHLSIFGLGTSSDKRIPQGAPPRPAVSRCVDRDWRAGDQRNDLHAGTHFGPSAYDRLAFRKSFGATFGTSGGVFPTTRFVPQGY